MKYTQKVGLAIGASLAITLTNLWMKQFESLLKVKIPIVWKPIQDLDCICPVCKKNLDIDRKVLSKKIVSFGSIKNLVSLKKLIIQT